MARKKNLDAVEKERLLAELHRDLAERARGYRERALAIFPHLCARCGREFAGKRLKELTVHHRDHNHDNNPSDGSNWELLCVYCHDNEHSRYLDSTGGESAGAAQLPEGPATHNPFANLKSLLKSKP